jgi:hypothetical protein
LEGPSDDEEIYGRSDATPCGSSCKQQYPDNENLTAAIKVAERATQEQQRSKQEDIRLNHPLNVPHGRMEVSLQCRKSDIHNRSVK